MRYLGLDLGTKSLGVAISDSSNTIATPLQVITFPKEKYDVALTELLAILKKYDVAKIALGLPKNMDGSEGFASERSKNFKKMIEEATSIPVILIDERLTTIEAEKILLTADTSRQKRKKVIDKIAAVLILEIFIKKEGAK